MKINNRLKNPAVWVPVALALSFIGGMWTGGALFVNNNAGVGASKINTVLQLIASQYVDEIDPDSLIEQTLPDLLSHLDPHTVYIPASDLQSTNDELDGSFSGIGITFQMMSDTITVVEVISGGPAEKVGLMPGDRIVAIDDSICAGRKWTQETVLKTLRGPKDTKVKVTVKRETSKKPLNYDIVRGDIPVTSIDAAYMITPEIGYIKVNKFGTNTYSEFFQAANELRGNGAEAYVIDLRGNGGGFMEPAILMANEFLPRGAMIVSTRGRIAANNTSVGADGSGSLQEAEVVVLIDDFSASASEIFAGAIQDNDRGLIVGRRSFGKGLVQNQILLPDSSALRLTVARYYTPSGRCIQKTYTPGSLTSYSNEILERYNHGEAYSADSVRLDKSLIYRTITGREVFGGGGIMPDVFVGTDTTGVTSWYLQAANAGMLQKFAFRYCDSNRRRLSAAKDVPQLLKLLPADDQLLQEFADYCSANGIPARWYYINISSRLIVNQLKALIARDVLDTGAFYRIYNEEDNVILRALSEIKAGHNHPPLQPVK